MLRFHILLLVKSHFLKEVLSNQPQYQVPLLLCNDYKCDRHVRSSILFGHLIVIQIDTQTELKSSQTSVYVVSLNYSSSILSCNKSKYSSPWIFDAQRFVIDNDCSWCYQQRLRIHPNERIIKLYL